MQRDGASLLFSPTDLVNSLGCAHLAALDLRLLDGRVAEPAAVDDGYLDLLKEKGMEHERAYLATLAAEGRSIREIARDASLDAMVEATRRAMRGGVDVIYQGALAAFPWRGYSDFLIRVGRPSDLGPYSYEVVDTKLARTARAKHVVQLCLYSDIVGLEQGLLPDETHVVLGDGTTVSLRVRDYLSYVRTARRRFERFIADGATGTCAEPCRHCPLCRWRSRCEDEWERTDHLSRVARITRGQRDRLGAHGITTLRDLAQLPPDVEIPRLQRETLDRIRDQARLQLTKRETGANVVELLPAVRHRGLARLPLPNAGDLFFDMEGDPVYSSEGSLEYLFGFHHVDDGVERFTAFWARSRAEEQRAFEQALDFITTRLARFPDAYVYHYAAYEAVALRRLAQQYGAAPIVVDEESQLDALKRLAQRYGTRENEVDDLLRNRKLVDLYRVVREGVRVSEPSYSLKNLEVFFAPIRTESITGGGESVVAFERFLVSGDERLLEEIERYNEFDCRSTRLCRDWLVGLRPEALPWFDPAAVTSEEEEKERGRERMRRESDRAILVLREDLVRGQTGAEREWRELLGFLLEYHRREARRAWWDFFSRLNDRSREELIDDIEALGGVRVDRTVAARAEKRSWIWTFRYPAQETKLCDGGKAVRTDIGKVVTVVAIDEQHCRVEVKVGPTQAALPDELSLIPEGPLQNNGQREAIARCARAVVAGNASAYGAVLSILSRRRPMLAGERSLAPDANASVDATVAAIAALDGSHLVVQGPPGSGKTYTSAHAIVDLIARGQRVAVTALSHKAINNLLCTVEEVAAKRNVRFRGVKKNSDPDQRVDGALIGNTEDNKDTTDRGLQLVAGTAWLFARPEHDGQFDFLFVDEAGQMSLADVVATGGAARNIVLVGDQMQLAQPTRGAHPGGSGVSALEHLMQGAPTVPPERGIFLAHTWRMHPLLCQFISDAFYDGRLAAVDATARQRLDLGASHDEPLAPHGLRFFPVVHEDNSQRSDEEAAALRRVYDALLDERWIDRDGETRSITKDDILVVSPYNMQVTHLIEHLPEGARVGTVDRFQGQEAAVVLISLASSSGEHVPRGISFLFSRNRLNVAISRARCLAVVFASELLLATACNTIEQLGQVNTLCWASEESARQVALARAESVAPEGSAR